MRRASWIFALGCITVLLYMNYLAECPVTASLSRAMTAAGATPREICFSGFSRLPADNPTDADLRGIVRSMMDQLGVKPDRYQLTYAANERQRTVQAAAMQDGVEFTALAGVISPAPGVSAQTYIMISAKMRGENPQAEVWHKKVGNILSKLGGSPHLTTCLVGWLDGKLEKEAWRAKLDSAGKVLGAAAMDTFVEPGYVNSTAYSPLVPAWIAVGDKRVNLNMAIRFSPYDNRTYFVIGSPVIVGDY